MIIFEKSPRKIESKSPVDKINPTRIGPPSRRRGRPAVGEGAKISTKIGTKKANRIATALTIQPLHSLGFLKALISFCARRNKINTSPKKQNETTIDLEKDPKTKEYKPKE